MMECASNSQLRRAFEMHLQQTRNQLQRFEQMGESPKGETYEAMQGLVAKAHELIEKKDRFDPQVMDAALVAAVQKVEHYEIASYGTVANWAELLGKDEAKELLG
jgi:ferritin-like metal-binding protein YciE